MRSYIKIIIPLVVIIFLFPSVTNAITLQDYGFKGNDLINAIFSGDSDEYDYEELSFDPGIFNLYDYLGGFLNTKEDTYITAATTSQKFVPAQMANISESTAGLTLSSPFYFLETVVETIGTFFTFGDLKKAERYMALATERLAEVEVIAEEGKPELVEKTLERYRNQLEKALSRVERAKNKGENTVEVTENISEATQRHIGILEEVLEKVPEQAKSAIEQAMTVSTQGSERASEAVSSGQGLELLKAKCLESGAPLNVCESLEEALQSSRPLKTLCLEQGGTQEMCDMFPSNNFRSFKQIEDYCLDSGGPADICASLEGRCRELGITIADQCFRVLSISTVTTFTSAEPTRSVPQREIDPDCPRGHVTYGQIKSCCVDSDIGLTSNPIQNHYYTKGTLECKVINTADGTLISHTIDTDSCEGDKLIERKYDNVHKASFEEYVCPNGCEDGACIWKGIEESDEYRTIRHYTPDGMIEYLETPEGSIEIRRVEPPGEE